MTKRINCRFCDQHWEIPDDWDSPNPEICALCRLERGMYRVVDGAVEFDKTHDKEVIEQEDDRHKNIGKEGFARY
jgi:hypothetical protein